MSENALPDETSVHAYVGMICFKNGPPHHVGVELEWLLASTSHPYRHLPLTATRRSGPRPGADARRKPDHAGAGRPAGAQLPGRR